VETKKPICGFLSVGMPLVGLALGFLGSAFIHEPSDPQRSGPVTVVVILSFLCPVSGIVLSIIAILRRERFRWLPIFGLVWSIGWALSYFAA
jgi:hypothetical protein